MIRAGTPAAVAAVMGLQRRSVGPPAMEADARMRAEMSAGDACGQRLFQRLQDGVDDGRKGRRIIAHRRSRVGADDLALRQDELDRPERAFIGHFRRAHQIFEGHARNGLATAVIAGIDRTAHLGGHVGKIDRQLVAVHNDLDADRHRRVAGPVIVEKGLGRVNAVRHGADHLTGDGF